MNTDDKRWKIFDQVNQECVKQGRLWGEQDHPDVDPVLIGRAGGCTVVRMCEEVGVPHPGRARANLAREMNLGRATWSLIAVEELSEAVEAATLAAQGNGDLAEMRTELVQLAAVAVSWIEALDRRSHPSQHATDEAQLPAWIREVPGAAIFVSSQEVKAFLADAKRDDMLRQASFEFLEAIVKRRPWVSAARELAVEALRQTPPDTAEWRMAVEVLEGGPLRACRAVDLAGQLLAATDQKKGDT